VERTVAKCGKKEVRIQMAAAGLNRADLLQRAGTIRRHPV
jgi:NADPH:quinone reductase-like Zn-dependent oxidoreductase|tara:strand:- start:1292 stop:1411 length:120 start_codon:yes stop_codon:yes gene_type:complete